MLLIGSMTGMTEEHILWELPLCRGYAYMHAALIQCGNELRWCGDDQEEDEIMARAKAIMESRRKN